MIRRPRKVNADPQAYRAPLPTPEPETSLTQAPSRSLPDDDLILATDVLPGDVIQLGIDARQIVRVMNVEDTDEPSVQFTWYDGNGNAKVTYRPQYAHVLLVKARPADETEYYLGMHITIQDMTGRVTSVSENAIKGIVDIGWISDRCNSIGQYTTAKFTARGRIT